jgi:hypothetical protein
METQNAVRIIEALFGSISRDSLQMQLEAMNEDIHVLVQKLQESAALSGLKLRQYYKQVEKDKEEYLLQMLDSRINSLQFYDIITQKLDHLLRTHFLLIEDLKKGLTEADVLRDTESFLIIFPELMKLHEGLLQLIWEEYSREINELESHFIKVSCDQIPKEAVDIQLKYYRKQIEERLAAIMKKIEVLTRYDVQPDNPAVTKLKSTRFKHVLSLYTMNSEREVFRRIFSNRAFCELLSLKENTLDEENDVELF